MTVAEMLPTIQGVEIRRHPFGSSMVRSGRDEPNAVLAERLDTYGYLFLPGFFERSRVLGAQAGIVDRLSEAGWLESKSRPDELVAHQGLASAWLDGLADDNVALTELLYGAETMHAFSDMLGGPARHFDFTWARATGPGQGTAPHCDIVFMGRGTPAVVTMWTALSDIPEDVGGLAVLPHSHLDHDQLTAYRQKDVDTYCENLDEQPMASMGKGGSLPLTDPNELADLLGSHWVWEDYAAGDVLMFGLKTVHASLDNRSNRIRLSCDTRYQLAAAPIDERWVGASPTAHSLASQRARIC